MAAPSSQPIKAQAPPLPLFPLIMTAPSATSNMNLTPRSATNANATATSKYAPYYPTMSMSMGVGIGTDPLLMRNGLDYSFAAHSGSINRVLPMAVLPRQQEARGNAYYTQPSITALAASIAAPSIPTLIKQEIDNTAGIAQRQAVSLAVSQMLAAKAQPTAKMAKPAALPLKREPKPQPRVVIQEETDESDSSDGEFDKRPPQERAIVRAYQKERCDTAWRWSWLQLQIHELEHQLNTSNTQYKLKRDAKQAILPVAPNKLRQTALRTSGIRKPDTNRHLNKISMPLGPSSFKDVPHPLFPPQERLRRKKRKREEAVKKEAAKAEAAKRRIEPRGQPASPAAKKRSHKKRKPLASSAPAKANSKSTPKPVASPNVNTQRKRKKYLRTSDFDIDNYVAYGVSCSTAAIPEKDTVEIQTPTFRIIADYDDESALLAVSDSDSDAEDTSDEAYENRHWSLEVTERRRNMEPLLQKKRTRRPSVNLSRSLSSPTPASLSTSASPPAAYPDNFLVTSQTGLNASTDEQAAAPTSPSSLTPPSPMASSPSIVATPPETPHVDGFMQEPDFKQPAKKNAATAPRKRGRPARPRTAPVTAPPTTRSRSRKKARVDTEIIKTEPLPDKEEQAQLLRNKQTTEENEEDAETDIDDTESLRYFCSFDWQVVNYGPQFTEEGKPRNVIYLRRSAKPEPSTSACSITTNIPQTTTTTTPPATTLVTLTITTTTTTTTTIATTTATKALPPKLNGEHMVVTSSDDSSIAAHIDISRV